MSFNSSSASVLNFFIGQADNEASKRPNNVQLVSHAIATPPNKYSQKSIPDYFGIKDEKCRAFFECDHIESRYLYLPQIDQATGKPKEESFGELLEKFSKNALAIGSEAISKCLATKGLDVKDIDYLCCVTSTGFIIPGLSALVIKQMGLRVDCQRADIVGMGCNAGLNGLNTTYSWATANPNKNALLLCVEICSAIYSIDETPRTAIVNSLFGDGAAALLLKNDKSQARGFSDGLQSNATQILDFESHLIPEHSSELRFDWDNEKKRYSFYVGKNTPTAIAAVAEQPVRRLLDRHNLDISEVDHWIVHGGGNSILLGLQKSLGLTDHDLRHTRSVLREYGNLSSGSFLFSYNEWRKENKMQPGEYCVMMTMGPGLTIELALLRVEEDDELKLFPNLSDL